MKPKEYLLGAERAKRRYKAALEEIEYIRTMASGVKAIRYDKDQIQSSPENDQMAEYMARLDKAEARAVKAAEIYLETYTTIREQINQVTPMNYADVLYLRYILGMKLWDIAEEMNFDYSYMKHMHGRALQEFGRIFADVLKEST